MVYRLLAVNIDGTLLQTNSRLHKTTKEAIEFVHQKGVFVALVTSRNFASARKVAKALKIKPHIVAHQGAYVGAFDKPILVKRISEDLTLELVKLLEVSSSQIKLYHEKYMIGNRVNLPENLVGKASFYKNEPFFYSHQYVDILSEALAAQPAAPPKIDVICDTVSELKDLMTALGTMYDEIDTIQINENKFTIVPKGVSKWDGLRYLAQHLNVRTSEIVAIGDGTDDFDMIEQAGLGVAMGNAVKEVKSAADWQTRTNDQQGVAYTVKELFRKQQQIEHKDLNKDLKVNK
ncbi:Cof subfamily protein (haloacid dehalogenase superfamily) [Peribacillus deserti]|uniref:Cof subfamily protein (Haloacid dehalogenase superfamily) n=1 Tax=Peribacillus deserti TaxID=673318 RepID=A0ABS2QLV7_9BACI|nr:Cof-type HAD-IIB family hydrolase [Peribacillus deserti]MBM7694157.1 Cof subfamily protein (haloacid dehalogenase superfamily) [Peribacillus deserti]